MKIPPRIIAPILLASICAGLLLGFLWWQLTESTLSIQLADVPQTELFGNTVSLSPDIIDTEDQTLLHMRQGDVFALRGDWKDAEEAYDTAVKEGGGLPALRKLASAQLQRRNMRGVESTLKQMKTAGAKPEDIVLLESIILLRNGELLTAQNLVESAEDSPQKEYALSLLRIVQGNHQQATEHLQRVIEGWDPVLRSYGKTLLSAYEEFSLFPEGSDTHLITLLSRALAQVQECELALPLLVQVTTREDQYRDAWIVQGYCELISERTEQSLASLEHAYSLDPQKPEIQYFLARSYAALGEYQNAITFFEYAIANGFAPQEEIRRLIAKYALELQNPSLALDQYRALTEVIDASKESYKGFITVALTLHEPEQARGKAEEAVQKWPDDAEMQTLLEQVREVLGTAE